MLRFIKTILLLVSLTLTPLFLQATHNRAGEIRIEQIGSTIRATIVMEPKPAVQMSIAIR